MLRKITVLFALFSCCVVYPLSSSFSEELAEITIVRRDTLIGISKKLLEDPSKWREVARINNLSKPYRIFPNNIILVSARLLKLQPDPSKVTFVAGEVVFQNEHGIHWKKLLLNDIVEQGAVIKTGGSASTAELTFSDGTVVYIRPDTIVGIAASGKRGETITDRRLTVKTGRIITRIRKALGIDSGFKVHTPSAVAGVKGTEFRTSVDAAGSMRSEVLDGVVELDAMNKKTLVSKGEGALVKKGEPPAAAVKLLPAPEPASLNAIYKTLPLELSFKQVEEASSYRITLAKDRDFRYPVSETLIKPNEVFSIATLEDGIYYMRSSSIDSRGLEGSESVVSEINLRVNPVPPFTQSPADQAEIRSRQRTVSLAWLKVSDAVSYHFQLAEDREFNRILNDLKGIRQTNYTTSPLEYRTYYFRICSTASDGYEAAWSDVQSFTIVPPPPAPPLEKPDDAGEKVQIRWQKMQRAAQYRFQMAKESGFSNILIDKMITTPSITISKPAEPGIYYVRTSSIDHKDFEGDFSQPQSFEIKPPVKEEEKTPYELITIIGGAILILLLAL